MRASKAIIEPTRRAVKKSAHHPMHDLCRAYEYQGRIEILEAALAGSPYCEVSALSALAEQELAAGHPHNAAELLRAAEHITFAALAPYAAGCPPPISAELKAAVIAEFNHITCCAELHWSESNPDSQSEATFHHGPVAVIYANALGEARRAFIRGAYRPALELARAAEALAKTTHRSSATLPAAHEQSHRLAS